jgi:hypothetical protein
MEDTPCSAHTSISRRMRTVLFEPQLIKEWGGNADFVVIQTHPPWFLIERKTLERFTSMRLLCLPQLRNQQQDIGLLVLVTTLSIWPHRTNVLYAAITNIEC